MKARISRLGFVVACVVSATLAQPSPPATSHPPAIQKMIDAPIWYFSYMIRLEANGTDGSGSHSLSRVTNGRMMLGIRSGGPSLSIITNPTAMVITQPDHIDRLIANYANWISGPPREDEDLPEAQRMTEAQADALWHRVRRENIEAHQVFRYDYNGRDSGTGGTDRTQESGSGTVWHVGEPAFEIDAANRKFKLMFSAGFAEGPTSVNARTRIRETGIGTIHYVRQETKHGLSSGEEIASFTPAISTSGFFEGTLPNGGNISYSSVHAIRLGPGLANGIGGTFSIQFTLSPDPPAPVEMIIEPPTGFETWRPIAGDDEKTAGEIIPITVRVQKPGGGSPQFKPVRFTYRLTNTSREKGVCLNWPPTPETNTPYDLQFEQQANPNLTLVGYDGQVAVESVPSGVNTGKVNLSCFDYGASTDFEAFAELENGQVVYGVVRNTAADRQLKVPLRNPSSNIALAFLQNLSHLPDNDDSDNDPVGDGFLGDGLTLYEEYRGFKVGDDWTPGNPKKKDVFVLNQMRTHPFVSRGISLFETASKLVVHKRLRDDQVNPKMEINFHRTSGPHIVDQHVIRIIGAPAGQGYANVEDNGTPGTAKAVHMPPDCPWIVVRHGRPTLYFAATLAHEMVHCCNVYHHGEQDDMVYWYQSPGTTQMFEQRTRMDAAQNRLVGFGVALAITVKKEDGTVVSPNTFFGPGNTRAFVPLGKPQGQHSGVENCLMRYDNAFAYPSTADPGVRYLTDGEPVGTVLCTSPSGTGVNASGRRPQSRYGPAANANNGGPDVLADRGDCAGQLRVNDRGAEPKR